MQVYLKYWNPIHSFFLAPFRNYGGVYVGLPADLTTVASSQSKSTRKGNEMLLCILQHWHFSPWKKERWLSLRLHPQSYIKTLPLTLMSTLRWSCSATTEKTSLVAQSASTPPSPHTWNREAGLRRFGVLSDLYFTASWWERSLVALLGGWIRFAVFNLPSFLSAHVTERWNY